MSEILFDERLNFNFEFGRDRVYIVYVILQENVVVIHVTTKIVFDLKGGYSKI